MILDFHTSFNPLDRGNLYLIIKKLFFIANHPAPAELFQSPRSGEFVSNVGRMDILPRWHLDRFQSPRSGKFVSNLRQALTNLVNTKTSKFQSPRSGKFVSN